MLYQNHYFFAYLKEYSNTPKVSKILHCLSKYWDAKVKVIFKYKETFTYSIDHLLDFLWTKIIQRNSNASEKKNEKIITFKYNIFIIIKTTIVLRRTILCYSWDNSRVTSKIRRRNLMGRETKVSLIIMLKWLISFSLNATNHITKNRIAPWASIRTRKKRRQERKEEHSTCLLDKF